VDRVKKRLFWAIAASVVLLSLPTSSYAKTTTTNDKKDQSLTNGVTAAKKLTKEQNEFDKTHTINVTEISNDTDISSSVSANLTISPFVVSQNYKFSDVSPWTYVDTIEDYQVSTTENVGVVLVQYPSSGGSSSSLRVGYQLVADDGSGKVTNTLEVDGTWSSQSKSITFINVQPGRYILRIKNWSSSLSIDGNGYVYY
jgi:hypothetical protein